MSTSFFSQFNRSIRTLSVFWLITLGALLGMFRSECLAATGSEWRTQYFGAADNSGNAHDMADPDNDRIPNVIEYCLNQDPLKKDATWGTATVQGSNLTVTYTRRKAALDEANIQGMSATDLAGPWSSTGVVESILSDNGTLQVCQVTVAISGTRKSLKLVISRVEAPTGVAVEQVSPSELRLVWAYGTTPVSGFKFERRLSGPGAQFGPTISAAVGDRLYLDGGLAPVTTYVYEIWAENNGAKSVRAQARNTTPGSSDPIPAMASNVLVSALSTTSLKVQWNDNSTNETGFRVEGRQSGTSTYVPVADVPANTAANPMSFTDIGLLPGVKYYYRIASFNGASYASFTDPAATGANNFTFPPAPGGFQVSTVTQTQINLAWTDGSNETGYRIERRQSGTSIWNIIAQPTVNSATFADNNLTANTTYHYRLYVSNPGGTSDPAIVSGTTTTQPPATSEYYGFNFQPIASSAWPSNNIIAIQAGQTRVEQWLNYGGSICWVSLNGGGNMVNVFDLGRQIVVPLWMGPQPYSPAGYDKPPVHASFPHNPLQTGDAFGNPSTILAYGYESATTTHYVKVRAKAFPLRNYETGVIYEVWSRPVGNAVRYWNKITVDRNNDAEPILTRFQALPQEFPCVHATTDYPYLTYYAGEQPFTGGALTQRDIPGLGFSTGHPLGENWFALLNGSGQGMAVHGPHIWTAMGKKDGTVGSGPYGDNTIYAANPATITIDPVMTLYTTFDVMAVNTPSDIRSHASANTGSRINNNLPTYEFSQARQGFYAQNATANDDITGGKLVITHLNMQVRLFSPSKTFPANQVSTIYLRMRNNSPETALYFYWRRAGQTDQDMAPQRLNFNVPNDGQWHVVTLNMSGQSAWTGMINYYGFQQQNAPESTSVSGRSWEVTHFGMTSP